MLRLLPSLAALAWLSTGSTRAAEHVIVISIDGLRPEAIETLGAAGAPTFARIRTEGAWTHNARTDHDWTWTVPNHSSMVTARPVNGADGHNYTSNGSPASTTSYHSVKGSYVAGVFDVAHDHGLKTGFYYSKSKLVIIDQSYDGTRGAADTTGADDGKDKIDITKSNSDNTSDELTATFLADLAIEHFNFALLHLVDPDRAGHGSRWQTTGYYDAVSAVDSYIDSVIDAVEADPVLNGNTTVIVTTDHGGAGSAHSDTDDPENYTIPFYVWGAGVASGSDLYALNPASRADPSTLRVAYTAPGQPIRNADCANLALDLLGLPPVPCEGAGINGLQDLEVGTTPPGSPGFKLSPSYSEQGLQLNWTSAGPGSAYIVDVSSDGSTWIPAPGAWPISGLEWTDPSPSSPSLYRVRAVATE